eukprot:TRINITY_DN3366_c1_g1_i1.p1 TRINITY_DN3366_c1_g1~~TRINITY_DN3366_c1_g1_i1.p1  ORF type:complete len:187 (+),score=3.38 TRINITY_DN3366_c1_g1_i1:482-1042(+)
MKDFFLFGLQWNYILRFKFELNSNTNIFIVRNKLSEFTTQSIHNKDTSKNSLRIREESSKILYEFEFLLNFNSQRVRNEFAFLREPVRTNLFRTNWQEPFTNSYLFFVNSLRNKFLSGCLFLRYNNLKKNFFKKYEIEVAYVNQNLLLNGLRRTSGSKETFNLRLLQHFEDLIYIHANMLYIDNID